MRECLGWWGNVWDDGGGYLGWWGGVWDDREMSGIMREDVWDDGAGCLGWWEKMSGMMGWCLGWWGMSGLMGDFWDDGGECLGWWGRISGIMGHNGRHKKTVFFYFRSKGRRGGSRPNQKIFIRKYSDFFDQRGGVSPNPKGFYQIFWHNLPKNGGFI